MYDVMGHSIINLSFFVRVYIHSVVGNWKKCLQSAKLKDSLLSIV